MKIAAVVVATALAAPLTAAAQPGLADPRPPAVDDSDDKSPGLALSLSLLGTAASYATLIAAGDSDSEGLWLLGLTGIVVGPSLGQFYAGETSRGLTHSLFRVGAAAVIVAGLVLTLDDCWGEEGDCDGSAGPAIAIGGMVLGGVSTVYSIVDSPAAAVRHNEARRRRFVLTPTPLQGPDRSVGYGMALAAQF